MKNKSFTLIELLVVIVIIGILSGVILISISGYTEKARLAKAQAFSTTTQAQLGYDMVTEWKFDNPSDLGEDTWKNNNGVLTGTTFNTEASGECVSGGCLTFDGVDDFIQASQTFTGFTGITLSAWIKPSDTAGRNIFNSNPFILHYRGAGFYLRDTSNGASGYLGWSPAPNSNEWSYVVATWESPSSGGDGKMRIYLNGEKQATELVYSGGTTGTLKSGAFSLGKYFNTGQIWFKGLIDEVKVFRAGLPISKIKQQYVAGLDSLLSKNLISKEEYNKKVELLGKN